MEPTTTNDSSLNDSQDLYEDLYEVDLRKVRSGSAAEPVMALGGVESISSDSSSLSSQQQHNEPETPQGWVFASNMTWWSTDQELEELFSPFGRVIEISFEENKETGKSKGAAWIVLSTYEQALEACRQLHGTVLHNQVVEFSAYSQRSSTSASVSHGSTSAPSSSSSSGGPTSSASSARRQIRPSIEHNKRQTQQHHHQPMPYPPRHGRPHSNQPPASGSRQGWSPSDTHDRSPSSSPSSNDYPHSYSHSHTHSHSHSHSHSSHPYPHSYSQGHSRAPSHSSHLRPRDYSRHRDDRDDRHRYRESPPRR